MQSLRRMLVQLTLIAGVGLLSVLLVTRIGTWSTPWPLPLLDTFALYAFAPFAGLPIIGLLLRSRVLAVLALAPLIFFLRQFGGELVGAVGLLSRATVAAPEKPSQIRVLTLNVQAPYDDPSALVALIRAHEPDLLVLQETTTGYASALDRVIAAEYPYSFMAGIETEHEGAGTWSRLPLLESEAFRLSDWGNQLHRVRVATGLGQPAPPGAGRH
jgi:endonuclease/exonuclease/phosphatase (EEP) superfamily protein YafD